MIQTEIAPHGGRLVENLVTGDAAEALRERAHSLRAIHLADRRLSDLEMLGCGAFSPLHGFMTRADYQNVVINKRLANGLPWTIPVTLAVTSDEADLLSLDEEVALVDKFENVLAVMHIEDIYKYDRDREAREVYRTTDQAHPGVRNLFRRGEIHLGGRIQVLRQRADAQFLEHRTTPAQMRRAFAERGWKTVVGFQTRTPIHRAHEYITKCALEITDGLLVHPLYDRSTEEEIPAEVRMECYKVLLENYYPASRVMLAILPAAMCYAGPREAVFHAIVRKNFGCTHFIVGRDHAGVGNYYGSQDAQYIFDEFSPDELGIVPLKFDNACYCPATGAMGTEKSLPENAERLTFSGTKIRQMLMDGVAPPPEFTRPEVAQVLIKAMRSAR